MLFASFLNGFEDLNAEDQEKLRKAFEEGKVADGVHNPLTVVLTADSLFSEDIPPTARKPEAEGDDGEEKPKKKRKSKKKDGDAETVVPEADSSQITKDEDELEDDSTDLRNQASAFMSTSKSDPATSGRTEEDVLSTPLPGETLAMFYARSRTYRSFRRIFSVFFPAHKPVPIDGTFVE